MRELRWPASSGERGVLCKGSSALIALSHEPEAPKGCRVSENGRTLHLIAERVIVNGEDHLLESEVSGTAARYVAEIMRLMSEREGSVLHVEKRLELTGVPLPTMGRADAIILSGDSAVIADFKSGTERVSPRSHQMFVYAASLLCENPDILDFTLMIVQPRNEDDPIRVCHVTSQDVRDYVLDVIIPAQTDAINAALEAGDAPDDDWAEKWLTPGSHCTFCPARKVCPLNKRNAIMVGTDDVIAMVRGWSAKHPEDLSEAEVERAVFAADEIRKFLDGVEKRAVRMAESGHRFDGMCLSKKSSGKRWTDEDTVAEALAEAGIPEEHVRETRIRTVAQIQKLHPEKDISHLWTPKPSTLKLVHARAGVVPENTHVPTLSC